MDIKIDRQSVCMGDDVNDHGAIFSISESATFTSLFQVIIKSRYFPNVSGNDVVWVLQCGEDDIASWKTGEDKIFSRFIAQQPSIRAYKNDRKFTTIYFCYYSSPLKRAQHIFQMFGGDKFHIWHEGFMPEYESYHIPSRIEAEWLENLL